MLESSSATLSYAPVCDVSTYLLLPRVQTHLMFEEVVVYINIYIYIYMVRALILNVASTWRNKYISAV